MRGNLQALRLLPAPARVQTPTYTRTDVHLHAYLIFLYNNKNKHMESSLLAALCPHNHPADSACLSPQCPAPSPFHCPLCAQLHQRCKTMRLPAVHDYLLQWRQWVCKEGQQFMARVGKVYANARDKLKREEEIFEEHCRTIFMGKDHSRVISLIERKEYRSITSALLSSSLSKITEPTPPISFDQFTLSEMRRVDEKIRALTEQIAQLYKGKEVKRVQPQKLVRCCSATLQKSRKNDLPQRGLLKSSLQIDYGQLIKLKTDLTFPKAIDSRIIDQATHLNRLLGKKVKKYHLTFRASENSFSINEFYHKHNLIFDSLKASISRNSQKRQLMTIIMVKTQFGKVLGGMTPLRWENKAGKLQVDSDEESPNPQNAFPSKSKFRQDTTSSTTMFSLDLMQRYDLLQPDEAIYCGKNSIGFGRGDLRIVEKGHCSRRSSCKFPCSFNYSPRAYLRGSKSGMVVSGSKYSPFFKMAEWQSFLAQL